MSEKDLLKIKRHIEAAYLIMNAYASGETVNQFGRHQDPNETLANVYLALQPAHFLLSALNEEQS